jgi:hypothetical protein
MAQRAATGPTNDPGFYLEPVTCQKLVEANRDGMQDETSRTIVDLELGYIKAWRQASGAKRPTSDDEIRNTLTGLALSGGGIRSAVFALGVTEALARHDKLRHFDYLSTVSGGGYLGSSITWLKHHATPTQPAGAQDSKTFPYPVDPPVQQQGRLSTPRQDAQLIHLREHGKFLTPGNGIDAISLIAVLIRGFLLNVLVWLPILAFLLLMLMLIGPVEDVVPALDGLPRDGYGWMALVALAAALLFVVCAVFYSFATFVRGVSDAWRYHLRRTFETWIRYPVWVIVIATPVALIPFVHGYVQDWIESVGIGSVLAGLASAAGTFLRGRARGGQSGAGLSIAATAGAALMLYGFLLLGYAWADDFHECARSSEWPWVRSYCDGFVWTSAALLILAVASGHFVNVNLISVHRFYRDRLMEAFLPDEPVTNGSRFTFPTTASKADVARLQAFNDAKRPTSPYHLLNTNVILVDSKDPTRHARGGDSFVLSPRLCGSNATGWCRTDDFLGGDLTLATAMAISGAAANPYAGGGLFLNRPVAVLMALANVRLGYWVSHCDPNMKWKKHRTHFGTAWRELSGKLDEGRYLLQLSDGGHFENLGVYELVRRRARLIVACDGTADPEFGFKDFISLLSRIEADFGARIQFDPDAGLEVFVPSTAAGFPRNTQLARKGYTIGKISYSDGCDGDLIYITTTLFAGLALPVLGYRAANPDFPDQTTADQFFDEAQFEAYRHLGFTVGEAMIKDAECASALDTRMALSPSVAAPARREDAISRSG